MQAFLQQQQISKLKDVKITLTTPTELKQQQGQVKYPNIPPDLFFSGEKVLLQNLVPPRNISRRHEILLYHATNVKSLMNILENGVQVRSGTGTLGHGFYLTPSASGAVQWARRGGYTVVIEFAVRSPKEATVSCVSRNADFDKNCRTDCMFYTAYETKFMHRYKGGYLPYFWQYVVKDQKYFDSRSLYIKQVFLVLRDRRSSKQGHTGGAAAR